MTPFKLGLSCNVSLSFIQDILLGAIDIIIYLRFVNDIFITSFISFSWAVKAFHTTCTSPQPRRKRIISKMQTHIIYSSKLAFRYSKYLVIFSRESDRIRHMITKHSGPFMCPRRCSQKVLRRAKMSKLHLEKGSKALEKGRSSVTG